MRLEDPIGYAGGNTNFYRYVGNDPVNFIDPTGKVLIPAISLTYAAYETGFFIGATYNKLAHGVDYSSTYRQANPIFNMVEQILPNSSYFLNKDTYKTIEDRLNNQRIKDLDMLIDDDSNRRSCK